ncbi:hypothetical protein [Phaeovulum sp.]|uniref:hypothetical protein n=1 Tax=Phaeovulum sp. TaxID=2934796 RepID=UPI003563E80B
MENLKQPFEGEPQTREISATDGQGGYHVTVKVLTPRRAWAADIADVLTSLYVALILIGLTLNAPVLDWAHWAATALFLGLYYGARPGLRDMWRKTTKLRLDGQHIAIWQDGHWVCFDRKLPHRFGILQHDYAPMEKLKDEFERQKAQMKRKVLFRKPYYGDSFIVCLEYLGQRHDLVTVYSRKEASAVVARLQACGEIIESRLRQGRGAPIDPADQWGHQPGDLETPASSTLH